MPLKIPPELKKVKPFVLRAEELDRDKSPESRLVAYYCRQFAVQTGISLATSPDGKRCLGELLNQLESEKQAMSVFTPDESHVICKKFADRIFDKADAEDRAGAATKGTAKTFYAAASFYEILQQFYEKNVEEEQKSEEQLEEERKRIYCKWKATEILKAIKEGRTPEPGGYGESNADNGGADDDGVPVPPPPPVEDESPDVFVPKPPPPAPTVDDSPEMFVPKPLPPVDDDESPDVFVPKPPPPVDNNEEEDKMNGNENDDDAAPNEEGTEVDMYGPAPTYPGNVTDSHNTEKLPGWGENKGKTTSKANMDRPPMSSYQPPPPAPAPKPPVSKPAPVPAPAPAPSSSWYGSKTNNAKKGRVSKEAFGDAVELTKFALAALENKDADLAAERLRQALEAIGR